jgi:hypothetical protein
MHLRALVLCVAVIALPPAIGRAQELPPQPGPAEEGVRAASDVVYLRCGDAVHGRLKEVVPKDHVTIVTDTGETRRIAWSEVDRVVVGVEEPSAAPPPVPPRATGPLVRVHIASPDPVILYHRPPSTSDWIQACSSPCDAALPAGDEYQIAGVPGSRGPSKPFHLEGAAPGRTVVLSVSAPSGVGTGFGIGMVILGGLSLYTLTIAGLFGAAQNTCAGSDTQSCGLNATYFAVLAGAVAITTLGGILWHSSDKTDIDQVGAKGDDGSSPASSPMLYKWRPTEERSPRADAWQDTPPSQTAGITPAFTVPILSGSF